MSQREAGREKVDDDREEWEHQESHSSYPGGVGSVTGCARGTPQKATRYHQDAVEDVLDQKCTMISNRDTA